MRLITRDLGVRYPAQPAWAVDGVTLTIESGRITWLSGALGSGTSTLLLALAGLAPRLTGGERRGTVLADDRDPAFSAPLSHGIAYLGPSPELQLSGIADTVRDEVAIAPMNLGHARPAIVAAVDHAIWRLEITHLSHRPPAELSGGETQRMLIAALLAGEPRAWLLDEPFSALDHAVTGKVQELLREQARAGATVVIACDDADTMLALADRLIVMRAGKVMLDGNPAEILAGDAILASGAGTTDAATLARDAGYPAPRPLDRSGLMRRVVHDRAAPAEWTRAEIRARPASRPAEPKCQPVLQVTGVGFAYPSGPPVLEDISLTVHAGEAVGIFGANGAGKSTLLRLAMALEHPTTGSIVVLGESTTGRQPEDLAPRTGFLFQQPERQLFATSVRSECGLAPRLAGWPPGRVDEAVITTLHQLGLADTADEHPYDLPLPTRRLIALAAILAADPELILLDEPTAALDSASRLRIVDVLRERIRRGRTVVAITHDAGFAHEALDRGVVLEKGQLVKDASVREVMDDIRLVRPAALAVAMELGLPPGLDRRADVARMLREREVEDGCR
ncbi:MAG: ABC transporter ATP-binding protein [Gemmatimonadales bacterium]